MIKNFLLIIFTFCFISLFSQTTVSSSAAGVGSWTVPCGVTTITVQCWGGGGGGGGDGTTGNPGGAGGSGGGNVTTTLSVVGGQVYSYTVGAGGTGGGAGANGSAGGNTIFSSITATGGPGGAGNSSAATGTVGGSGGTVSNGVAGAAGGASGGNGGAGGGTGGGAGGAGGASGNNGTAGTSPGGGGGGGGPRSGGSTDGANGGIGRVSVTYVAPSLSAGTNQTLANCATTANLAAAALPAGWSGSWSCLTNCAGVSVTTPTSTTSGVTGLSPGFTTTFQWLTTYSTGCYVTNTVNVTAVLGSPCNTVVPANNNCASATPISLGTQISGTTLNSTNDVTGGISTVGPGGWTCANSGNVWYSFTTGATVPCLTFQSAWMDNVGCNNFQMYTSGCPGTQVGWNQSANEYNDWSSTEASPVLAANTTYYISVGGNVQGPFTFSISAKPAATNDICSGAQTIGTAPVLTDNAAAGCEYSYVPAQDANATTAALCAGSLENISWFTFTASSNGTVTITLADIQCNNGGGGFQTGLLTGTCASYTVGTSGTPICAAAASGTVTYNITSAVAGQTYLIAMDGNAGSNCHFFVSGTNIVPLPVELSMFNAKLNGNYVDLIWATLSEKNNDYFTIERSADGVNFEPIGTVKGAGSSSEAHYYYFQDKHPLIGVSYYRLKQTDFSKRESYSVIQSISIDKNNRFDFKLFPNPADKNEDIRLQFSGRENDIVTVMITDLTGNVLSEKDIKLNATSMEVNLKHHFGSGIYFVKVSNKYGDSKYQKFIVE